MTESGNHSEQPIPTGWINQVGDDQLRVQELTWRGSRENRNSPQGKVLIPAIQTEMQERGLSSLLDITPEENIVAVANLANTKTQKNKLILLRGASTKKV